MTGMRGSKQRANAPQAGKFRREVGDRSLRSPSMSRVSSPHVRFTVEQLFDLVEMDLLETNRVELINGRIYRMPAPALPHLVAISRGNRVLMKVMPPTE